MTLLVIVGYDLLRDECLHMKPMINLMLQHCRRVIEDLTAEVGDGQQAPRNIEDTKAFQANMHAL